MPELTREQAKHIVEIIRPYCQTTNDQVALYNQLFWNVEPRARIAFGGDADSFAWHLVTTLTHYGEIEPGVPALWQLLFDVIGKQVGLDKKAQIESLRPAFFAPRKPSDKQRIPPEAATTLSDAQHHAIAAAIASQPSHSTSEAEALAAQGRLAGTQWRDPHHVPMVYVPAGRFMMGSASTEIEAVYQQAEREDSAAEREWFTRETPQHPQLISAPFWLDLTPVTNASYAAFVEAGGYRPRYGETEQESYWTPAGLAWLRSSGKTGPTDHFASTKPEQPRVGICWHEAHAYCRWRGGRLPTEAEWEWAARGPDSRTYPWGNDFISAQAEVVYLENSGGKTAPVGEGLRTRAKSWVGALDMSGNVWEWVSSFYRPYPYESTDEREVADAPDFRVLRGGGWFNPATNLRAAFRFRFDDIDQMSALGFRCARAVIG
jgi:formylglycine-generating enzyme required for sulfatase activity